MGAELGEEGLQEEAHPLQAETATGKQQCSGKAKAAQFERKLHGFFSNSLKCRKKNSIYLNQQKNSTNLWHISSSTAPPILG